jgi:hypothetical protein
VVAGLAWPDRDPVTLSLYRQRNSPLDSTLAERFDVTSAPVEGHRLPADTTAWILPGG